MKNINKFILLCTFALPVLANADVVYKNIEFHEGKVLDPITGKLVDAEKWTDYDKKINDVETIPSFLNEKPLRNKDKAPVKFSKEWRDSNNFVVKEPDGKTTFAYGTGQPTIICSPIQLCMLELQAGEKIVQGGVQIGDPARWKLDIILGNNNIFNIIMKPLNVGLNTSLIVVTDRRTYHMNLRSTNKDFMALVGFRYPLEIEAKMNAYRNELVKEEQVRQEMSEKLKIEDDLSKKRLDFKYTVSDCDTCIWKPVRVYNDGKQTFIQMNKQMTQVEAPALTVISENKEMKITNYRVYKDLYIIDALFVKARLISGVGYSQKYIEINYTGQF